ncbi:putative NADH-quinone oxidoreductase [Butyriboletus roseoflavus]|nr:putative NADH-quinone oxidoreductase [Butyriboletus roseoflavus]
MSSPKVAIIIYSLHGHIAKLAESVKQGIADAGGSATIYQIAETLSEDILAKMHAPPKPDYPILNPLDLKDFNAYLFGIPTRYGNFPAQWKVGIFDLSLRSFGRPRELILSRGFKVFWDATGGLWTHGTLAGKFAGVFVSTGTPGGGQEATVMSSLSTLTHHGICFVPLGYKDNFPTLANTNEVRGGSPWGAGTFAGADGTRQPTPLELSLAKMQGQKFWEVVSRYEFPVEPEKDA